MKGGGDEKAGGAKRALPVQADCDRNFPLVWLTLS